MERIVDVAHRRRQSKLISLKTDTFFHFERAKMLPIELLRRTRGGDIGGIQPNQIAGFELDRFVVGVIVFRLKVLRVFDVLNEAFMNFMKVGREFFGGRSGVR